MDYAFYNAGDAGPTGIRRMIVPVRRLIRRVLRPIFLHQADLMRQLAEKLDETDRQVAGLTARQNSRSDEMQAVLAFGWDYVAMARRLAVLEDRLEVLTARDENRRIEDRQRALPIREAESSTHRAVAG